MLIVHFHCNHPPDRRPLTYCLVALQAMDIAGNTEAASALPEPHDVNMQQAGDLPAREGEAPSAEAVVPSLSEDAVVPREVNHGLSAKRRRHL